jgi:hypothetical protein
MQKLNQTSINSVIKKVNTDYFPSNNGWYADAIGWIGEGLEEIGTGVTLEKTSKEYTVTDYKLYIPPGFVTTVLGVVHENNRLMLLNGTLDIDKDINKPQGGSHYYMFNRPNYIDFSFKEGTIKLFYEGIAVDCDGFVLIPDDVFFLEALAFRVLHKLLGRGMLHPVWTLEMAWNQWEYYRGKARGNALMPTPDAWNTIMENYNSLIPNYANVWR